MRPQLSSPAALKLRGPSPSALFGRPHFLQGGLEAGLDAVAPWQMALGSLHLRDLLLCRRREGGENNKTKRKGRTTTELRQRSRGIAALPPSCPQARPGAGAGAPRTYHDSGRGRRCLGGHRSLVGLVLRSFDFGLQVCRRVKIFAFLPHATPLYVIHTNGYGVVVCVDHGAVCGVCKAAVGLSPGTVSSLEFPAYLRQGRRRHAEPAWCPASAPQPATTATCP